MATGVSDEMAVHLGDPGEAIFTLFRLDASQQWQLRCDHADPVVRIGRELAATWHERKTGGVPYLGPYLDLECAPGCPAGDIVRIKCDDRTLVYVIAGEDPADNRALIARWPD